MSLIRKCSLCDSHEFDLVKTKLRDDTTRYKVFRCKQCTHYQLFPKPTEDEDRDFYNENLQDKNRNKEINYCKLKKNNMADTRRRLEMLRKICKNKKAHILDIGSGYGFFVDEIGKAGYRNVLGIEISDDRRAIALRHTSARILKLDINEAGRGIGTFDVITLFHVLEHISEPIPFLRKITGFLKPKGLFICEVPNVNEFLLEHSSQYYDFYWIRAHLNYFSKVTLHAALKKAGFESIRIDYVQRYGLINLCNWLLTGAPQIKSPVFTMSEGYAWAENYYRRYLEKRGRSDALVAFCRKH